MTQRKSNRRYLVVPLLALADIAFLLAAALYEGAFAHWDDLFRLGVTLALAQVFIGVLVAGWWVGGKVLSWIRAGDEKKR